MVNVLVMTIAHPPEDARIRHREIVALLEQGHQVTYAAPFRAFGSEPRSAVAGLRLIDLPHSAGAPHRRLIPMVRATAVALRESRPDRRSAENGGQDVILVHDPELLPPLAIARLARWFRRRRLPVLVWDVHEDPAAQMFMLPLPAWAQRAGAAALTAVERLAERAFRLLLAETPYQERFRRPHPLVPNSVRVPTAAPQPAEKRPRVVYLGALTRARGSAEIIEIARRLPDVTVEVLGNARPDVDTELRQAMVTAPNLRYRGFVPNTEALQHLPGALAGLSLLHDQPNYAHSQPTKVMEYMAHGLPAITTPNEASRALVTAADAGAVIGFGDVDGAVRTIREWDADRATRDRLAANAYRAALDRHNWNTDGPVFAETLARWVQEAQA